MLNFSNRNAVITASMILFIATQSCKTTENTNPVNACRLSKYVVNTYTDSPDYVREMKYNQDGNLILHKVNGSASSQPSSISGIIGEKDSIIYKNKEIYKVYHFNNRFGNWGLETEKEYFYSNGKVSRIVSKNVKLDIQVVRSVTFDRFSYNTNNQLKTEISYQKELIYPSGSMIPNINTIPSDSVIVAKDTTLYTFENNNLVKKENHYFTINRLNGIVSQYPTITQTIYSGYDNKINPFYKLPIETTNFINFSENNFAQKSEIVTYKYFIDPDFSFDPGLKEFKSEYIFKQSFSYNLKGYPIDINNSNKLSVIVTLLCI